MDGGELYNKVYRRALLLNPALGKENFGMKLVTKRFIGLHHTLGPLTTKELAIKVVDLITH